MNESCRNIVFALAFYNIFGFCLPRGLPCLKSDESVIGEYTTKRQQAVLEN